jgi:hypothetical protein
VPGRVCANADFLASFGAIVLGWLSAVNAFHDVASEASCARGRERQLLLFVHTSL